MMYYEYLFLYYVTYSYIYSIMIYIFYKRHRDRWLSRTLIVVGLPLFVYIIYLTPKTCVRRDCLWSQGTSKSLKVTTPSFSCLIWTLNDDPAFDSFRLSFHLCTIFLCLWSKFSEGEESGRWYTHRNFRLFCFTIVI